MRHKLIICFSLTIVLLTLWGCSTGTRSGSTEETQSDIPEWFLNRELSDDVYFGMGMAKKQNPSLAIKAATARARDDIAQQISVKVENLMKDFMQESGVGENAQSLGFTSSVSKQIVSKTLEGSSPDKQFKAKDGTWYVRVKYSKADARNAMLESAKREEALFNEFKANQGFEDLEKAIHTLD
ncbi:MAG: hypothetical protein SCARUB_04916 [Candidatus Scalindua rubra]|uniref:Lipoprotein LPP20-like domain-containing protein n=1 Tax=Candidatus Scalindua rubra TaxID=1872076 RepID=A0A1E3X318_9BACT|nr:MAG: hypothetical protein SCARUB_04916 [Candidatus Scalindua rubra]